jgi:hypothetical protein
MDFDQPPVVRVTVDEDRPLPADPRARVGQVHDRRGRLPAFSGATLALASPAAHLRHLGS